MRWISPTILLLCLLTIGCRDYDIIFGETYYAPHRPPAMSGWGQNLSRTTQEGAEIRYQGIYAQEPYGQIGLVRRFDRQQGWSYVTLIEALPLEEGTLIQVHGTVVSQKRPAQGVRKRESVKRLRVDDYQVLYDTRPLKKMAQREYGEIRRKLQESIALPGSRLKLSPDPDWRVDWCAKEKTIVVVAYFYDLMYAAEAQFLFPREGRRLQAVYFWEWFKGE